MSTEKDIFRKYVQRALAVIGIGVATLLYRNNFSESDKTTNQQNIASITNTISNTENTETTEQNKLPKISELERKVFIYHQDLGSDEMLKEAMATADVWMPHMYEIEQQGIFALKKIPVYEKLNKKKKKHQKPKITGYKDVLYKIGEKTVFINRASKKTMNNIVKTAATNGKYLMPMVSAFNKTSIDTVLNNPEEYSSKIAKAIKDINAQGVSIDLESIRLYADKSDELVNFMKILREKLPEGRYQIAIAVSPRFAGSAENGFIHHGFYNYKELSKHVDFLHLMCYDFHKDKVGPVMPADMLSKIMDYALDNAPKEKIVPLFPLYGYVWKENIVKRGKGKNRKTVKIINELGSISSNNNDAYFKQHKPIKKDYNSGELYTITKDKRIVYTQDKWVYQKRLQLLDTYRIKNVGGWRQTHGSREIYNQLKNWKQKR